jgi:hypothetical protein
MVSGAATGPAAGLPAFTVKMSRELAMLFEGPLVSRQASAPNAISGKTTRPILYDMISPQVRTMRSGREAPMPTVLYGGVVLQGKCSALGEMYLTY